MSDFIDRLKVAHPRIKKLFDKYPVVSGLVFLAGAAFGLIVWGIISWVF